MVSSIDQTSMQSSGAHSSMSTSTTRAAFESYRPSGTTASTGTTGSAETRTPTSAGTTATAEPFDGFSLPVMWIEIDGQTYVGLTAGDDPLEIVLSNGTLAVITEHDITVDGETVRFPDPGSLTPQKRNILLVNGWQVRVYESAHRNARYDPSAHGGQDLFSFLTQAIKGVSAAANNAAEGLSMIAGTMMGDALALSAAQLAGSGLALDEFAMSGSAAQQAMANGVQKLHGLIESFEMMDLGMNMVNTDLASNGVPDPRLVRTSQLLSKTTKIRTVLNDIKNIKNILKILRQDSKDIGSKILTLLRGKYKTQAMIGTPSAFFAGGIAVLYSHRDAFPPGPPPGNNSTTNSTVPDEKPFADEEWKWFAQTDLPIPLFHYWTKLIDSDQGIKSNAILGIHTTGPTYYTTMNDSMAMMLRYMPGIAYMERMMTWEEQTERTNRFFRFNDEPQRPTNESHLGRRHTGKVRPRGFLESPATKMAAAQYKMSFKKEWTYDPAMQKPWVYRRDDSEGAGATIFILDSGIDLSSPKVVVLSSPGVP
ncbi:hypothetical protein QBC39DRAFT_384701 [Podospora conica]|nr:hypothetical protein QBC39DRAFT_384701 [Schizothecium conicum]